MKKIIYLIDTLQTGGAEKSLLEITKRFQRFKPIFLTIYQGDHALKPAFQQAGISVIHLAYPKGTAYKNILPKLKETILALQPSLIHASLFHSEMLARKLKLNIPIINSLVNNSYHPRRYQALSFKEKLALLRVYLLDRFTIKHVDHFIANSSYMAKVHKKNLEIHDTRISIIPRGRDPKSFQQVGQQPLISDTDAFDKGSGKIFLHVGRLISRKGQEELIRAFKILNDNNPTQNHLLWIVGKGEQLESLQSLLNSLEIQNQVKFLGDRSDVPALLAVADYFVFPSHYEGLPGALIEAMMAKIPIIASDIPENKECLSEEMAIFHQIKNPQDLAQKLQEALQIQDWPTRTQLAYEHAIKHFHIENIVKAYEELYSKLIK